MYSFFFKTKFTSYVNYCSKSSQKKVGFFAKLNSLVQNRVKKKYLLIYLFFCKIKFTSPKSSQKKVVVFFFIFFFIFAKLHSLVQNRVKKQYLLFSAKLNSLVQNWVKKSIYFFFAKLNSLVQNRVKKTLVLFFFVCEIRFTSPKSSQK